MADETTNINSGGGTVVTGNISSENDVVLGDKNVTINQILANQELTNEATVLAYLEQAARKTPPPHGSSAEIERLWNTPFSAHQSGESSIHPVPIWRLVRDRFEFAQNNQLPHSLLLMANAGLGKTGALSILMDARATLSVINYKSDQAKAKAENSEGTFRASRTFIIPILLDLELLLDSDMSVNDLVSDAFNRGIPAKLQDDAIRDLVTKEETEAFLGQYTCLFLVDNLDLLITKADHFLIKMVRQFVNLNHRHQFVIACRPTHYRGQLGRHERIFLNELSDVQVENIIDGSAKARLRGPMRDLARNRSHLRMIIDIPRGRRSKGFPPLSKGHLIQHAERKRLDEAFSGDRRQDRLIDIEVAEEVLERLAFEMSRSNQGLCSDSQAKWLVKEFLEEWDEPYNWRVVMNELRGAGIIKRVGRRDWGFVRRKTEAYFSAASLTENINKVDGNLDKLAMPRGNETLEILAGLISNPEYLIDKLIAAGHIFTAAHVGQFVSRELDSRTINKLFDGLVERMKGEHASRRAEIALQLGESGHEAAVKALIYLLLIERSSLVVKSIAMAIWVCINQIAPDRFDKILHQAVESLKDSPHVSGLTLPNADSLLTVLHVFERGDSHHMDPIEQHQQLIELVETPNEHRLVRGLAGFGLGLMADGLLERGGRFSKLSKKDARALNQSAREKLLQFL
ncbi:MAG: NACHT domain-containing NTPase, partial [Anaerolineae bacterium]